MPDDPADLARPAAPSRVAEARTRALAAHGRLMATRNHFAPVDIAIRAYERDRDTGGGVLAAAVAFRLFLFMVPFVFVVFTVFGLSAAAAGMTPGHLARVGGITGLLGQSLGGTRPSSTSSQVLVLVAALWVLGTTARSSVKVLAASHSLVWRVPVQRPKATAPFAFVGLVVAITAMSLALARTRLAQPTVGFGLTLLSLAIPLVVWWRVALQFQHDDAPEWALLPGAAVMAVGLEGLHLLTVYYVAPKLSGRSETYGTLGAAVSVLFWTYAAGRLIVGSAVLNATLWHRYCDRVREATGLAPVTVSVLVEHPGLIRSAWAHVADVRELLR